MKTLDNDVRTLYIVFNLNRKGGSSNAHQAVNDRKNCIYDPYRLCVRSSGESPEVTFRTSLSCLICRLSVTDKRFFMSGNKSIKEEIIMSGVTAGGGFREELSCTGLSGMAVCREEKQVIR